MKNLISRAISKVNAVFKSTCRHCYGKGYTKLKSNYNPIPSIKICEFCNAKGFKIKK